MKYEKEGKTSPAHQHFSRVKKKKNVVSFKIHESKHNKKIISKHMR